ncbi:MAG: GIY-YIG nuclease family protein [Patescibacteria group bacterium]
MLNKQDILNAIRKTAEQNGGKPLGMGKFEKETGIKPYDWNKYWARFSDAQKEAGLTSNTLQESYTNEFLLNKIVVLARKIKRFPTYRDIDLERRRNDPEFPWGTTYRRYGTKEKFAQQVIDFCQQIRNCEDVIELCRPALAKKNESEKSLDSDSKIGEVYLFKSGRYYKIGKTNDSVRRGQELRIQLPENLDLIHSIKTDDPSGIEAYWHRRFEPKRMNGEWFDLNSADIKAFKRWRRII